MRHFYTAALGLALFAGSLQASTITYTGLTLVSATLAGTDPNKLTLVVGVGGMTDGTRTATLTGAHFTFVTGLVYEPIVLAASGIIVYPFLAAGSSRDLVGGASVPGIASGTNLMHGSDNGGASLLFQRTGPSGTAGTYSVALPSRIVTLNPTLAQFFGLPSNPDPALLSFASKFSFNANTTGFTPNSGIASIPKVPYFDGTFTLDTTAPEPASIALMGAGLAGLSLLRRRSKA